MADVLDASGSVGGSCERLCLPCRCRRGGTVRGGVRDIRAGSGCDGTARVLDVPTVCSSIGRVVISELGPVHAPVWRWTTRCRRGMLAAQWGGSRWMRHSFGSALKLLAATSNSEIAREMIAAPTSAPTCDTGQSPACIVMGNALAVSLRVRSGYR